MEGKAAILFSGSAYNIRQSLESINKNLVEENDADVFIVTTRRCKRRKTPSSSPIPDCDVNWEEYNKKNSQMKLGWEDLTDEEIQLIRDTFGNRLKVFEIAEDNQEHWNSILQGREQMLFTINNYIDESKRLGLPVPFSGIKLTSSDTGSICYTLDQYRHLKRCYEVFEQYEKETNTKYDYVIRARIDFKCLQPLNVEHYLLNHDEPYLYVCGGFHDITQLHSPFEWMEEFCFFSRRITAKKLYPNLDKIGLITTRKYKTIDNSKNDTIFSPECQFALLVKELNIKPITVRIWRSSEYTCGNDGFDYFNYRLKRAFPIDINYEYENVCKLPTDINEHCPYLYEYASKCKHVTELGQRYGLSTIAFLKAAKDNNSTFHSYDPQSNSRMDYMDLIAKENNIDYKYFLSTAMNHEETESLIEETELLFIDTNHHVDQISKEVTLHSPKVKKYMAFHDMSRKGGFWHQGQGYDFGGGGMKLFMEPFMEQNKHIWKVAEWRDNNNGLLILERINN